MNLKNIVGPLLLLGVVMSSCDPQLTVAEAVGMKPIYANQDEQSIALLGSRDYENLGGIVYKAPYIFLTESYRGIHVVDNSDPVNPIKIAFISIPGCNSFTVRNDKLYAVTGRDLVTLEYSESSLEEVSRLENYFAEDQALDQIIPPNFTGFFECVDPAQGLVVGWSQELLQSPECRTN